MASLLRQIVAGPRARHPEAGLDLCYVTDNIIATSGPSQTYPQRAYRNPLDRLVAFLDEKHGKNWAIWEFRAEGTGYPDDLVYNRIRHYPWPDHHPPPFRLVPMIMASMRNWLNGNDLDEDGLGAQGEGKQKLLERVLEHWKDKKNGRVVVVHCKAGKGRSGTSACSFLISECGWTPEQALARFTERRMRPKFGAGVSIPSQLRWIGYVDRWTKGGKTYIDREVEILEVHVWGLRHGVKVEVEGFTDEGKKITVFHTFKRDERLIVEGGAPGGGSFMDSIYDMAGYSASTEQTVLDEARETNTQAGAEAAESPTSPDSAKPVGPARSRSSRLISTLSRNASTRSTSKPSRSDSKRRAKGDPSSPTPNASARSSSTSLHKTDPEPGGQAVIFKPAKPIRLPTSDVNVTLERRNRAPSSMGLTMVTAVAHVWFNTFFEGDGPERDGVPANDGIFDIEWDKMDGIKGSSQKGTRAADRIAVVWRTVTDGPGADAGEGIPHPKTGEPVPQMQPADWKGANEENPGREKKLGLRVQSPDSAGVSQASSINGELAADSSGKGETSSLDGVKSDIPNADPELAQEEQDRGRKADKKFDTPEESGKKLEAYAEKLPSPEGGGSERKGPEDHSERAK